MESAFIDACAKKYSFGEQNFVFEHKGNEKKYYVYGFSYANGWIILNSQDHKERYSIFFDQHSKRIMHAYIVGDEYCSNRASPLKIYNSGPLIQILSNFIPVN